MKHARRQMIHGMTFGWRHSVAASILVWLVAASAMPADVKPAPDAKPAIDPQADAWLKRMGDFLAQQSSFAVNAEIWQDIRLGSGQRIQCDRVITLQVRRPDCMHAEVHSTHRNRVLNYDGKVISLLNRDRKFYGSIPLVGKLDEALDAACDRFGITMPLEDLIVSDPYHSAIAKVTAGNDLGLAMILGVSCEHLAFVQDSIDWQIWIDAGAKPVPRKIVITYKDEEASPQYTALFSNWDLDVKLPDSEFAFEAPAGAAKIDVAEIKNLIQAHKKGGK